jgi:hypothetical protein
MIENFFNTLLRFVALLLIIFIPVSYWCGIDMKVINQMKIDLAFISGVYVYINLMYPDVQAAQRRANNE